MTDVLSNGDSAHGTGKLGSLLEQQRRRNSLRENYPDASAWNVVFEPFGCDVDMKYRCSGIQLNLDSIPRAGDVVLIENWWSRRGRCNFYKVERVVATGGIHVSAFRIGKGFTVGGLRYTRTAMLGGEIEIIGVVKNPEVIALTAEKIAPA